jgi:hypothetical protein
VRENPEINAESSHNEEKEQLDEPAGRKLHQGSFAFSHLSIDGPFISRLHCHGQLSAIDLNLYGKLKTIVIVTFGSFSVILASGSTSTLYPAKSRS